MSGYVISKIFNVISRTNGAVAGGGTNKLLSANLTKTGAGAAYTPTFPSSTTVADAVRSGVNVSAYASAVYVKLVPYGTASNALTVSSTDYDFIVPINTTGTFAIDRMVDLIINSAGNWSATEVSG